MAISSEYSVNITISTKDKTSEPAKKVTKGLDLLAKAAKLAAIGFVALKVAQEGLKFVEFGAKVQQARTALDSLAKGAGTSGEAIISAIQKASDFTIDKMSAMEAANKAMLLQVADSPEKFAELTTIATKLGRAMGQDAAKSIDDFVTAAGRQSKQIADNLGLMVSAEDANEKYARSLGRSVASLTDAERKQAFLNEMLVQGAEKTKDLEDVSGGAAMELGVMKAAISDTKSELALMAAETFDNTVNTQKLAAAIRDIPKALQDSQEEYDEWSQSLGEAEAFLVGDAQAIVRLTDAAKFVPPVLEDMSDEFWGVFESVEAVSKGIPTLTFETRKYLDELAEHETLGDDFIATSHGIADVVRELAQKELADATKALDEYNLAVAEFSLDAGMQWTDYYRGVAEQAETFATDREKLETTHQAKIEDLMRQGQSKAIQIDETAELGKLEILQNRLNIALQSQAEFSEKTKLSTRMRKDAEIATLQAQISDQEGLLSDFYGGRLVSAGKNVDALIAEEDRRHKEAIAGLNEEIEKTKELQRQQLGTLMLQTFEAWGKMKDIPPEAMFDMRMAIAEEYGLIGEEEAAYLKLAQERWEKWATEDFKTPADEVLTILATEILQVEKFGKTLAELESPPPIYIDVYYREHGAPETVPSGLLPGMGTALPSNVVNNYEFQQTVNTQATTSNVIQDFETARGLAE